MFESETRAGKTFDLLLLGAITLSVIVVILESVAGIRAAYGGLLVSLEWVFTALFTLEYVLRLLSVRRPLRYAASFFGVVDLLAIAPTYASLLLPGAQYFLVIRMVRLLRVFRILKLTEYLHESSLLWRALVASRRKISVFLLAVVILVIIIGASMYVVEGEASGFSNIPVSMYWAIVTLTTVGYGDIAPATTLGQALASIVMLLGYAIIAIPTGIVTLELSRPAAISNQACPVCGRQGHDLDAAFCKHCGGALA
ncbi:MAG TPA: ion transporter [Herpetosiphonaceae bacterium]|nr:ion transporter [Herpetosiphonaceae bacterium]